MLQYRKFGLLITSIALTILLLVQCIGKSETSRDPRGTYYVGSTTCRQCHREIYERYIQSNHFKASSEATRESMIASVASGKNTFHFGSDTRIEVQDRDSGFYQVVYKNGKQTELHRLDLAFGIKHAQTYLYWKNNRTYELPVSYYSAQAVWATSPGFSPNDINFNRFIGIDCFECHSSYLKTELQASTEGINETLDRTSLITGIDCERCHGPAINHVNYHLAYPEEKRAKYMVSGKSLSRQQKLDECAVCHSGNDKIKQASRFDFRPGDTLANFFFPGSNKGDAKIDVHGNQYRLLAQSACFIKSNSLECSTCHNPHTNAPSNVEIYSARCVSCHKSTNHNSLIVKGTDANEINKNCVDCHMPYTASDAITYNLENSTKKSAYMLRTHRIAIYNADNRVVKNFIKFFSKAAGTQKS